jgi:hypothetical protein
MNMAASIAHFEALQELQELWINIVLQIWWWDRIPFYTSVIKEGDQTQ